MDFKNKIIYQIYPRSFKDTNQDGIGDIKGIISKLDYIASLGVNFIWLSPVYASPNADFGYDVSDYKAINPEYGTMADMDLLIEKAKEKGIDIMMDLVMNHTSSEHEWFKKSKEKDSPYRDYYIYLPPKKGKEPNNWTSFFGGKAWSKSEDGMYYLHLFARNQPDLNLKNPKVIEAFKDIMRFWLDKGIKGFRCDVVNVIHKDSLKDGKWRLVLKGLEHYHSTKGNHDILKTFRKEIFEPYQAITVGETVMVSIEQAKDLMQESRKELDMVFSFAHMETDQINNKWFKTKFKPKKFINVLKDWQENLPWNTLYFENHDQPRSISRFGSEYYHKASGKMLATLLLTLKGTPFIYQGQEIGMLNVDYKSIEDYQDVETKNIWALSKKLGFPRFYRWRMIKKSSRDNARSPMQWDANHGFTKGTPWLKINHNEKQINVEAELKNPESILSYYKRLIKIRKNSAALTLGDYKTIYSKRGLFAYERSYRDETYFILVNMTKRYKRYKHIPSGDIILANYPPMDLKHLRPYEALIIEVKHEK